MLLSLWNEYIPFKSEREAKNGKGHTCTLAIVFQMYFLIQNSKNYSKLLFGQITTVFYCFQIKTFRDHSDKGLSYFSILSWDRRTKQWNGGKSLRSWQPGNHKCIV